jgi:small subunit ribosomal protein S5
LAEEDKNELKNAAAAAEGAAGEAAVREPAPGPALSEPQRGERRPSAGEPRRAAGARDLRSGGYRGGPSRGGPPRRDRGGRGERGDDSDEGRFEERVVKINKCSTVVKGGRRFSFSALVVVGDRTGGVGVGFGKANEVPPAVEKGMKDARKNLVKVSLKGSTIPHRATGQVLATKVVLVPAVEGTGVIAGASVRAVVECAGIKDILTKVYGSTNPVNVVKATLAGLRSLRTREEVSRLRGVEL